MNNNYNSPSFASFNRCIINSYKRIIHIHSEDMMVCHINPSFILVISICFCHINPPFILVVTIRCFAWTKEHTFIVHVSVIQYFINTIKYLRGAWGQSSCLYGTITAYHSVALCNAFKWSINKILIHLCFAVVFTCWHHCFLLLSNSGA